MPTQFALLGDSPYSVENIPKYERMIERVNATAGIKWVVHLGDMKNGISNCRDEDLQWLHDLNAGFDMPFILTPGDNDWFDCKREIAGGWDRLDRLGKLRDIFYSESPGLDVVNQAESAQFPDFVENVYWIDRDVMFATAHLVGITGAEGGLDIHDNIQDAAVEWLATVFDEARKNDVAGVFIATQADIFPFSGERGWLGSLCPACVASRPYYEKFHQALLTQARTFSKPILLAVGDTHIFRVDKPLYDGDNLVEHFTRVEGFGEDQIHWVRIVVRPETSSVFEIHQEIIPENTLNFGRERTSVK